MRGRSATIAELAAPRARRLHTKRSLIAGAPTTAGVYLFRDRLDTVLYVGKARDLRSRLRSYFSGIANDQRSRLRLSPREGQWRLTRVGAGGRARGSRSSANCALRRTRVSAGPTVMYLASRGGWFTAEPGPLGPSRAKRKAQLAVSARLARVRSPRPRFRCCAPELRRLARDLRRGRCSAPRSTRRVGGRRRANRRARPATKASDLCSRSGAETGISPCVLRRGWQGRVAHAGRGRAGSWRSSRPGRGGACATIART
jgi:hypothetical protein